MRVPWVARSAMQTGTRAPGLVLVLSHGCLLALEPEVCHLELLAAESAKVHDPGSGHSMR